MVGIQLYLIRIGDALLQRRIRTIHRKPFVEQIKICNHYGREKSVLHKSFRVKGYESVDTSQIDASLLVNVTGLEIKLVAQQPVCRGIDMFALRIGIEADQTIIGSNP